MPDVRYGAVARRDLEEIYAWIADRAGERVAEGFCERIRTRCESLAFVPEQGTLHDGIRKGLRSFGIDRRVTILLRASPDHVKILRVLYGGRQPRLPPGWDAG